MSLGIADGRTVDTLVVGETKQLVANLPSRMGVVAATPTRWISYNENAIKVSESGVATAVWVGSALVTASNNLLVEAANIVVVQALDRPIPVPPAQPAPPTAPVPPRDSTSDIVLTGAPLTAQMTIGQSRQITATLPARQGRIEATATSFTSFNDNVVTVSADGLVTGKSVGTALVTAANNLAVQAVTITVSFGTPTTSPAPVPVPTPAPTGTPSPRPASDETTVELPRAYVNTTAPSVTGATHRPSNGAEFQKALDVAQLGDAIVLTAGATYLGNFVLPAKSGSGWITIRTSATDAQLPGTGQRMTPAYASLLPKIIANNQDPVIKTAPGANHYRFFAVEVTEAMGVATTYSLVTLGGTGAEQRTLAQVPSDIILDRVYVHGNAQLNFQRCITLNTARSAVINSYISECHGRGFDSQAIVGWNGPGPFAIVNNYLEGAGENLMFGGGDPSTPALIPADIEIRRNHITRPDSWAGVWSVKNLLELKMAFRVLIEANVIENNWVDAQNGFAVLLRALNDGGSAPWAQTTDVTMRYNLIRRTPHGLSLAGRSDGNPALPMSRLYIAHNAFEQIGTGTGRYEGGRVVYAISVDDLTLQHNSGAGATNGLILDGSSANMRVLDNVIGTTAQRWASWNFSVSSAEGAGYGSAALNRHATSWTVSGNIFYGVSPFLFPSGNRNDDPSGVGFASFPNDLSLLPTSALRSAASDGSTPGVNWTALRSYIAGVTTP